MDKGEAVFVQGHQPKLQDDGVLRRRKNGAPKTTTHEPVKLDELVEKTSTLTLTEHKPESKWISLWTYIVAPLLLTLCAAIVRFYGITNNHNVVWDEAHFGKFGAYYIQREFYFDVHPPLGKLLVGLSGYLAGFDGEFKFESGQPFPPGPQFMYMRYFNCIFGVLCTPLAYFTALETGALVWSAVYIALSVALEMLSLTLSKFILLDLMLLFFTVLTFFCLAKLQTLNKRDEVLTLKGLVWLIISGLSVGCVCAVKWVGLFITVLVGIYTVYELAVKMYQTTADPVKQPQIYMRKTTYLCHWIVRIVGLILVPFAVYVLAFKVHFAVLSRSGTGDGSISTLLQASLEGNSLTEGPRSVAYGSLITLRSQGLSPNLLHSHGLVYPEGSGQQQITTYGFKDDNNEFLVEFDVATSQYGRRFATLNQDPTSPDYVFEHTQLVKDGDTIRLAHKNTGRLLHSHAIAAAVLSQHFETTCYGGVQVFDPQDDWVIEVQTQERSPALEFADENDEEIHPVSTNFRLRHKVVGCYLATTGHAYPAWGFQQGEVVCKHSLLRLDKSTWWNIEDHTNSRLPLPKTSYVAPKPKFWKEFLLLNYGMMASNNALIPDPDHHDSLASSWWEWPILRSGLRMNGWGPGSHRYFLIGHPFVTIFSTVCVAISVLVFFGIFIAGRRQSLDLSVFSDEWAFVLSAGVIPFIGWVLHYLPFILMGRVTYLHHYVPALYFAIFVSGFLIDFFVARRSPAYVKYPVFFALYAAVAGVFWYYKPLALGMLGNAENFQYLKLFRTWKI